jgi:hypothetical protein
VVTELCDMENEEDGRNDFLEEAGYEVRFSNKK